LSPAAGENKSSVAMPRFQAWHDEDTGFQRN
jgi:hypothetical protein